MRNGWERAGVQNSANIGKRSRPRVRRAGKDTRNSATSTGVRGHEASNFDVASYADIPDDRLPKWVSGASDDRSFRHSPPNPIDWHPVTPGADVVDRSMSVRNVAAGHTVRTVHALEPGTNILGHVCKLSAINGMSSRRGEEKRPEEAQASARSHRRSPPTNVKGYVDVASEAIIRPAKKVPQRKNTS
jgi:hypothetical protein